MLQRVTVILLVTWHVLPVAAFSSWERRRVPLQSPLYVSTRLFAAKRSNNVNSNSRQRQQQQQHQHPDDPRTFRKQKLQEQARNDRPSNFNDRSYVSGGSDSRSSNGGDMKSTIATSRSNQQPQEPVAPPVQTIGGGTAMIFQMARQMFWENAYAARNNKNNNINNNNNIDEWFQSEPPSSVGVSVGVSVRGPPKWRPNQIAAGISDYNPQFRTSSPLMNNQGYAGTIWRNVRKNRPSLWRYALRTYDHMTASTTTNSSTSTSSTKNNNNATSSTTSLGFRVEPTNVHHEGALVACAKLGLWQRALEIYRLVEEQEQQDPKVEQKQQQQKQLQHPHRIKNTSRRGNTNSVASSSSSTSSKVFVTDNMLLSVIRACARASRQPLSSLSSTDEQQEHELVQLRRQRRAPLDAAVEILQRLHQSPKRDLPLVARHVNPIASAYQSLGLTAEAAQILTMLLTDRTSGPEGEDGVDPFNVHDVQAKDKASYSLLVHGAVSDGDFVAAIVALRNMTEAGLYPNSRHLNAWTEISERKTKHRTTRSWTKKRDQYWLESVRAN